MTDDEIVLNAITHLIDERIKNNRVPVNILLSELINYLGDTFIDTRLRNSLNQLYKKKKIKVGTTINDKYIALIN